MLEPDEHIPGIMASMKGLISDIHHAVRLLSRNRLAILVAVTSLAIGVGTNTAIFSVASAMLLRPLPFANPDRLVMLRSIDPSRVLNTESRLCYSKFGHWISVSGPPSRSRFLPSRALQVISRPAELARSIHVSLLRQNRTLPTIPHPIRHVISLAGDCF